MKVVGSLLIFLAGLYLGDQRPRPVYLVAIDTVETRGGQRYAVSPDNTIREDYETGRRMRLRYPTLYKLAQKDSR